MNASGANRRPSWASRANTGTNEIVTIKSDENSAGPTSTAASVITFQRSSPSSDRPGCASCQASMRRCAFSTITTAASTISPIAIAMPPSETMFAVMPW